MTELSLAKKLFELSGALGPIRGHFLVPENHQKPHPTIFVCHGFKGFKDWGFFGWLGESLAAAGFLPVLFNISGSGIGKDLENFTEPDLFGRNTYSRELADIQTVIQAVRGGNVASGLSDPARSGIFGHSRGGAAALLAAGEDQSLRVLVTWAMIGRLERWSPEEKEAWRKQGYTEIENSRTKQVYRLTTDIVDDFEANRERFDLVKLRSRLTTPHLLIHGDKDESVPFMESRLLARTAPIGKAPLLIIPGANHSFGAVHPFAGPTPHLDQALGATVDFFRQELDQASLA